MEIVMALVLEEVKALGAQNVFLGGSERGVSIALATYLYFKEKDHGGPLGGVFGFAGIFNKEVENWTQFNMEEKKKTPVFLYHGEDDVFINPRHAVSTYNHLIKKGLTQIKFKCDGKLNYELTSGCTRELS
jgi:predicted esterase